MNRINETLSSEQPAVAIQRSRPLRFVRDKDGWLDLNALEESVSRETVQEWLLARLAGHDPYLPIDHDNMETLEQVFIDLWRRADRDGRVRYCLEQACSDLLPKAWEAGTE